jgi:hypothetical protein
MDFFMHSINIFRDIEGNMHKKCMHVSNFLYVKYKHFYCLGMFHLGIYVLLSMCLLSLNSLVACSCYF